MPGKKCAGKNCDNIPTVEGENGVWRCNDCQALLLEKVLKIYDERKKNTL